MKVIVKTLKGEKFSVEVEASYTVGHVKGIIESAKPVLSASNMRIIFSGKVLKDADVMETCGVKENDFLVVMVTKPKKSVAPAPAAAAKAPSPTPTTPAPIASATTPSVAATTAMTPSATPAPTATSQTVPAAPARPSSSDFPPEVISNLTALGFPETEVHHCLRAAQGNPDVAVEFLTNGIPPGINLDGGDATSSDAEGSSGGPLQSLRNHPQFNDLRRLVQSNPAMLQQVLTQIGQQQPELLREINANQSVFLQMMNEPIGNDGGASSATSASGSSSPSTPSISPGMVGMPGADPEQMAQMMQNMDPGQLQMMATMMGLTPEQVQAVGRMLGQLPREQLQEYMAQAMAGGVGGSSAGGGAPGGQQVLRLNEEEMAAVDRLTEMGFDRADAAQAFLACDKNEALAANLLMDGGFNDAGFNDTGNSGGNNSNSTEGNDDEDMYS